MIQRIQSVYLFLVALLSAVLLLGVYQKNWGLVFEGTSLMVVLAESTFTLIVAIGSLFWYRNRQHQFVLNRLNLIAQLFLLGFFVYRSLNLSGGAQAPEKGVGMLIPIFSIVFLVLANRAIKKDEDLVKSADRLR
ncbi:MAG: DUF4293 domain-containing protein [Bacteroidetes bacterium]|nr:DUF4293 domain-containing protein [Bacteroidota bacterium]